MRTGSKIILSYSIIITLAALADSLFFLGNKYWAKIVEEMYMVMLISVPAIYWQLFRSNKGVNWQMIIALILTYTFIRIALFDALFNLFSGIGLNYIGTTDPWNILLSKLQMWQWWVIRVFFLLLTFIIWKDE